MPATENTAVKMGSGSTVAEAHEGFPKENDQLSPATEETKRVPAQPPEDAAGDVATRAPGRRGCPIDRDSHGAEI